MYAKTDRAVCMQRTDRAVFMQRTDRAVFIQRNDRAVCMQIKLGTVGDSRKTTSMGRNCWRWWKQNIYFILIALRLAIGKKQTIKKKTIHVMCVY